MISVLISVISLKLVSCQTTEYSYNYTVTYNPGQDCLPYDGSVVPDCAKYIDPITKQPYYHEHSNSKIVSKPELVSAGPVPRLQQVLGVRPPGRDLPGGVRLLPAQPGREPQVSGPVGSHLRCDVPVPPGPSL